MSAWTQQLGISWRRPLVSFFEQKAAILRELEDADLLWRFDVGEERVGVKIKDFRHQLIFTPEHVEVGALQPDADLEALAVATGCIWRKLQPTEIRHADPEFRFLTPMDQSYDEARRDAGDHVMTWPADREIQNVDFAVIFDLALDSKPKSEVHVEAGIVEQQEAAQRLARRQSAIAEGAGIASTVFPLKSLPEVGIYEHQMWQIAEPGIATQTEAFDLWSKVREKAEQMNVALSGHLRGDVK